MTSSRHDGLPLLESLLLAQAGVYPFEIRSTENVFLSTDRFWQLLGIGTDTPRSLDTVLQRVGDSGRAGLAEKLRGVAAFEAKLTLSLGNGQSRQFLMRGLEGGLAGVLIDVGHSAIAPDRRAQPSFAAIADAMPQMVWSARPDGAPDYYSKRWYDFTGVPLGSTDGAAWHAVFHPDDQPRALQVWQQAVTSGTPYEIEYRLRHHSGEYHWVLGRALPVRDEAGQILRWFGTCTDINETKKAAAYVELLSQELSHRIKNIFAIIQSLIGLSGRRAPESAKFAQELQARIAALGRAHDLARPHSDQSRPHGRGVTLHSLAREILRPYLAMDDGRITISGEDPAVDDGAATPMALILHELATNAKKYGALSSNTGEVHIDVVCDAQTCQLTWTERGGPLLMGAPDVTGFGTKLVLASAQSHLNGTIERRWDASGLVVVVTCPLSSLTRTEVVR
ncbi:hypothetical protein GCM10010873_11850 [Cypionkella aquatica]|uniref:histidine kinase n=1 Tax=Cypionkella aquatica TaxID=1756042 RepID=A0AA37X2F7_9RHOB|nr:PAS domain-containing protein [Cypionkella aquatica]GLS86211.1 hypothetical protein GCM10010873_11850 [Cypionkella aquatica]